LIEVKSVQALDEVWGEAQLILFKHSTQCSRSAQAYQEVKQFMAQHPEIDVHLVKVLESRPVSDEVEDRTGVQHESPQLLILRNGTVVWHAAHWSVTAKAVSERLQDAPGA
jgi:bacillithiol system protein YtxJ